MARTKKSNPIASASEAFSNRVLFVQGRASTCLKGPGCPSALLESHHSPGTEAWPEARDLVVKAGHLMTGWGGGGVEAWLKANATASTYLCQAT